MLTNKELTKMMPYARLAYLNKLKMVFPDIETESDQKRKEYSIPMGFKSGFFSWFDGKYTIETANAIANASVAVCPWIIDNKDSGDRLWLVDFDGSLMCTGISFDNQDMLQQEEERDLCGFTLYKMETWPEHEITVWVRRNGNDYLTPFPAPNGGSGTGFYSTPKNAPSTKPTIRVKKTTLASEVRFYCLSDMFEIISSTYDVNPYEEDLRSAFVQFQELPFGFEAKNLRIRLK